ncbi:bifunctional phosphoribosylaminoimidazolecarboxamide formyltransferase/IMP cyclohydrolase [Bdellovibrio bacteriovorus]|uniref:bifunctional phosphoribosylaminoimidazolecarboxamide formyltransferase/IMP cyclohydrolase n=1 Tax=Bdellovibrio bacteriovorus TaxID=959 RepID=UPI0021D27CDB|nr:bifunctional phosphoribosylaminoimidazolecarboxamide formyltransferase/IMP cyclohydrolase [Bdellovibrio bacteriovorus]UXR64576.1 bifunctional phosphoribosylaminoimidazolecarboxamide formyltransferase/IMP cyclohydrolase [Bdellovibrio bacteriovorus]
MKSIRRALLSVSDKTGLLELAKTLTQHNVELIASGGTAKMLMEAGHNVTPVEKLSGKGEAFQGRMKTISFEIASSLLFRRDDSSDVQQAQELGIEAIDLVVVNLYPFHETLKKQSAFSECIEHIDIGGPTLLRAGAKNFRSVTVLCQPSQYLEFIDELSAHNGGTTLKFRQKCAASVYTMTAFYDLAIAGFMTEQAGEALRYGENPHQKAFVLKDPFQSGLAHAKSLQGKEMSYNNYLDADFALKTLQDVQTWQGNKALPAAVVVKHNTPCGLAIAETPLRALEKAWKGDEKSSFGGIIALNTRVTDEIANFFAEKFVEVILAPGFDESAREKLKKNCRVMEISLNPQWQPQVRAIEGGLLVQDADTWNLANAKTVTTTPMSAEKEKLAAFAMLAVKNLKSNAIALCRQDGPEFELLTMGSGQTNRVDCIEKLIASRLKDKGIRDLSEVVLASDAFFPFPDSVQVAARLGVRHIIQPGGSVKDAEVIAEADKLGVAMMFTGRRHFLH